MSPLNAGLCHNEGGEFEHSARLPLHYKLGLWTGPKTRICSHGITLYRELQVAKMQNRLISNVVYYIVDLAYQLHSFCNGNQLAILCIEVTCKQELDSVKTPPLPPHYTVCPELFTGHHYNYSVVLYIGAQPAGASLTGHHYNYSVVLYRSTWYRLELPLQATIITILLCSIGAHGTGWSFPYRPPL